MLDTSTIENWDAIVAAGDYSAEVKLNINGVDYYDELREVRPYGRAFESNPSIGNAFAGELNVRMKQPGETFPRMAQIKVYTRISNTQLVSGWLLTGTYYIDTRPVDKSMNIMNIHAYDAMMFAEADYPSSNLEWSSTSPNARAVLDEIASTMGVELSDATKAAIPTTTPYIVGFPADLSMRETLGSIAAMYGGNFIINKEGKLHFIGAADLPEESFYLIDEKGNYITVGGLRILLRSA